jgi:hypothetical protein
MPLVGRVVRHPIYVALLGVVLALAGCGTSGSGSPYLANLVRTSLDAHPGFQVQSVNCPAAKVAKGAVVRCTATLADGHKVGVRATSLDGRRAFRIIASEMLADNVERGIVGTLAERSVKARALCPEHVKVVIGRTFDCSVTDAAGRHLTAAVTILDADGGFRVGFS